MNRNECREQLKKVIKDTIQQDQEHGWTPREAQEEYQMLVEETMLIDDLLDFIFRHFVVCTCEGVPPDEEGGQGSITYDPECPKHKVRS